jgi:hypothetical protein
MQLVDCNCILVKALCYKPEGRGFEILSSELLLIYLTLPAALGPGVHPASNRRFWGVKCGRCVDLTSLPPSVSRLSRQCGIINISQPCRPPWPVTGTALLFLLSLTAFLKFLKDNLFTCINEGISDTWQELDSDGTACWSQQTAAVSVAGSRTIFFRPALGQRLAAHHSVATSRMVGRLPDLVLIQ